MRKLLIFTLGTALVLAIAGPAMALDLNINFDFNVGGTNFTAITDGYLGQQASANVWGVNEVITKNDGKVISKTDLPNVDVDQESVPLGQVNVVLAASGVLEQLTLVQAQNTGFVLSKNEGLVVAKTNVEEDIYVNNINYLGGYPYDTWGPPAP